MTQQMSPISELCTRMLERTAVLVEMEKQSLDFGLLREFSIPQILDGCNKMASYLKGQPAARKGIQRELIRNSAFAAYYATLLELLSDDMDKMSASPSGRRDGQPSSFASAQYKPGLSLSGKLENLIKLCWENHLEITSYPVHTLRDVLRDVRLNHTACLIYLENYATVDLTEDKQQTVINSLAVCIRPPIHLSDFQKELLCKPFVGTRQIFQENEFANVSLLLESCPKLADIMRFLHEHDILEVLEWKDYKCFVSDATERFASLNSIFSVLGKDLTSRFIGFWERSSCSMTELRRVKHKISEHPDRNWDSIFCNYSEYVNLLYGSRFKIMDLSDIRNDQENILVYAIVHNKKHFIKLVDEHAELFRRLPPKSLLLDHVLYKEHFNLNDLNVKDLNNCLWMRTDRLNTRKLMAGRTYTFPELAALYDSSDIYLSFYHMLRSDSQDYRLKVFRQLRKHDVLQSDMGDSLPLLADKLSVKTLYDWKEQEFGHITGLTVNDVIQLLIHFEAIERLLPGIHNRLDAVLALRNLAVLDQVDSITSLKDNLALLDKKWRILVGEMGLRKDFLSLYQESIIQFLCNDGAYITETYADCLDPKHREAFYHVVKAELMGQLKTLKYFEDDLQRELDMPLSDRVQSTWRENISVSKSGMEAGEYDDFFSTMLLGTQPQRTCLSYVDGRYRNCLLSAFDSNKKVLYVSHEGCVIGRAFLRLTKGRLIGSEASTQKSNFTFVDLEDVNASRPSQNEHETMTLFLECPYISGINPQQEKLARQLLVNLACAKADALGTMLVLAKSYLPAGSDFVQTNFDIFISKSKAGAQYLDSLDGEATVSEEGSYRANSFLVREYLPFRSE